MGRGREGSEGGGREKAAVCEVETQSSCVPRLNVLAYSLPAGSFNMCCSHVFDFPGGTLTRNLFFPPPPLLIPSRWLQRPLFAVAPIRARQSILSLLRGDPSLLSTLQECYGAASLTGTGRGSVFRYVCSLQGGREGGRKESRQIGKKRGNSLIRSVLHLTGAPRTWNGRRNASSPSLPPPPPPREASSVCGTCSKSTPRPSRWVSGEEGGWMGKKAGARRG